jgi:hypothetical protein
VFIDGRVKPDQTVCTNVMEDFFGVFKRGHGRRLSALRLAAPATPMSEFDLRYSNCSAHGVNDTMRTDEPLRGIGGKRLTYRRIGESAHA